MSNQVFVCGGNPHALEDRGDCPDSLHDWPLPFGYVDKAECAGSRLANGWSQKRCPKCKLYGWIPGKLELNFWGVQKQVKA